MSIQSPSSSKTYPKHMEDPEEWFEPEKEVPVFSSWDEQLNTLHTGNSAGNRAMRERGVTFDENLSNHSPFADNAKIHHEVKVKDNIPSESRDHLLEDEAGDLNLELDEEGRMYQVNMFETMDWNGMDINGENIPTTDRETDLLGLHAIMYEDSSGDEYLLHWDPCKYDSDTGEKMKFEEIDGLPDLSSPVNTEENDNYFESYENHGREEGLDQVYNSLITGSNNIYNEANSEMEEESARNNEDDLDTSESVYDKAWEGERWRAMADAVRNLNDSMSRGYTPEKGRTVTF
ncbi:MAG: hypothetical protein ABEJ87_02595 [Candidatus Nanohalobium sp.]